MTDQELRLRREVECFPYVNRGIIWYYTLTLEQKTELTDWYHLWLDVTISKEIPKKPEWLK